MSFIKAGRLRAIATLSPSRLTPFPDVPTMGEAGYPSVADTQWQAVFAPRGTPQSIVERLNSALVNIMAHRDTIERLSNGGALPYATAKPAEFSAFVAEESKRWRGIVAELGAKVD
jgi:tripartite-type tricarboxylate transporter receptor subunit TctC